MHWCVSKATGRETVHWETCTAAESQRVGRRRIWILSRARTSARCRGIARRAVPLARMVRPRSSRGLNAPRENGSTLIEPPLSIGRRNGGHQSRTLAAADYEVQGRRSDRTFGGRPRSQLLAEALRNTRSYRDVSVPANPTSILLAGHQPEMFHPGVWLKNFVLARLAGNQQAVAVNLQIDSDAMKSASLRVPGGSLDEPHVGVGHVRSRGCCRIRHSSNMRLSIANVSNRSASGRPNQIRPLVPDPLV